jgi:dienelactone hydrolase
VYSLRRSEESHSPDVARKRTGIVNPRRSRCEQTVAAAHLRALPGSSRRRVEIVGWSLGAGVAVASALAGVHFSALAGFSTGVPT